MSDLQMIPFGTDSFADNPEPRCPVILLLDTSGSMMGEPIQELNAGLIQFKDELVADTLAAKRVEIATITFGPVKIEHDFVVATDYYPPVLEAGGDTPMGQAIIEAANLLRARKDLYKENGIAYFRPWIFLVTDGAPTDDWRAAPQIVSEGEKNNGFAFFATGVTNANMDVLRHIAVRKPLGLKGLRFRDMFEWLSTTLKMVSHSGVGDKVELVNPATPDGWASV